MTSESYYINEISKLSESQPQPNFKEKVTEILIAKYYYDFLHLNNVHHNLLHKILMESSPKYVELYNEFYCNNIDTTKMHEMLLETDATYKSQINKNTQEFDRDIVFNKIAKLSESDSEYETKVRELAHQNYNYIGFMKEYIKNNKIINIIYKSDSETLFSEFICIAIHRHDIIDNSYELMIKDTQFYNDFLTYLNSDKVSFEYTNDIYNSDIQKKIKYINMFRKNIKVNDNVYTYYCHSNINIGVPLFIKKNGQFCYHAIQICIANDMFSEENQKSFIDSMTFTPENIKFVFTYCTYDTLNYFINTYYDKIFNAVCNEQWKLIHYILHHGTNELFNLATKQGIKHNLHMNLNDILTPPDEFKIAFTITIINNDK
jgi:hypothetical protein